MSWGGPSDEFNIYTDSSKNIKKIEYWFKDWWDGASLDCTDNKLVNEICSWFVGKDASYPSRILSRKNKGGIVETKQLKRIADILQEILRLVKKDMKNKFLLKQGRPDRPCFLSREPLGPTGLQLEMKQVDGAG